jgi:hypothetical protein
MKSNGKMVECKNCGYAAGPNYCPHCGQEVQARRGPLGDAGRELLSELLSLDSRLLRSLRALMFPGRLTELYLGGKRAPFLRAMRLYLLASLIVFSTILSLETPDVSSDFDIIIGGEVVSPGIPVSDPSAIGTDGKASPTVKRSLQLLKNNTALDRWLIGLYGDRLERLKARPRGELLDILFSGLRRVLPLTLILFVPFLALALKVLYLRKRAGRQLYLDHLVFSLHYQSALFFALSTAWAVMRATGLGVFGSAITYGLTGFLMLVVYLPIALRTVYRQSRLWTTVKTVALVFIYVRLLGFVMGLSVLVAIWNA